MDVKSMAKLTLGKNVLIKRAEDAIERVFCCGGLCVLEYCEYVEELQKEIAQLYGVDAWEKYIQWRYEGDEQSGEFL